jgi:glycosyltransferase involved in cell wall biosynthesis
VRVLVVSNGFPPRGNFGTEFYTQELVHGLARRGHEVAVLHPERSGAKPRYALELALEGGIPVHLLHNPGDPRKRFAASYRDERVELVFDELLARLRPEVVHFTYLLWGLSLRLPEVAAARGIPALLTLTDYGLLCHRGQMFDWRLATCGGPRPPEECARCVRTAADYDHAPGILFARRAAAGALAALGGLGLVPVTADLAQREAEVRRAFANVARVIAPTRHLAQVFARAGLARERMVELCYAFDESSYQTPAPRAAGGPVRFAFLGQFAPHKGLGTLLAAGRELAQLAPGVPFEIVLFGGPSGARHRLYWSAHESGLAAAHARLAPAFLPADAARILAQFDALVAPSEWDENAPLAVLQARAAGLPVVASDVPGIAEVVRAPEQGRLVPKGDAGALARGMLAVLRGELRAPLAPGLALSLAAHLTRIEELYTEASRPGGAARG